MKRTTLCKTVRWFLHLHYDVRLEGIELLHDGNTHLLLPNHPAYIEPVILFAECWNVRMQPMCDEAFFRKPVSGWALRFVNAIAVPDLGAATAAEREKSADKARSLTDTAVQALSEGYNLVFYPSGHIKLTPEESIGNRRLAYEVCQRILDDGENNIRVIMLRTTGLEGSITSKMKTQPTWRRHVTIHFEDMTDKLKEWSELPKRAFNEKLEDWYNINNQ